MEISPVKKWGIYVVCSAGIFCMLLTYSQIFVVRVEPDIFPVENLHEELKYLVDSSKCKIPNLDPWNPEAKAFYKRKSYVSCSTKEPLTYVRNSGYDAVLVINRTVADSYSNAGVSCCYSEVNRNVGDDPDTDISILPCRKFNDQVPLNHDTIIVKCHDAETTKQLYENAHAIPRITADIRKRMDRFATEPKPPSVLFVGVDSISRLNFRRVLPQTYDYLKESRWLEYKGYNKIGDNTLPNLMAILTGKNISSLKRFCRYNATDFFDSCGYIWNDFKEAGYVTAYGEDEASISTFNYLRSGFKKPPTDFYFRPYMLAAEKLKKKKVDGLTYCAGPTTSAERILHLARDMSATLKDHPKFAFFWMNTFSHEDINSPGRMDAVFIDFFKAMHTLALNDTIVIFLSDHGIRFGDIRLTRTGWLEERLPFLYIWTPEWFERRFPSQLRNLESNSDRLTTPYDIHMTLQHALVLSGINYTARPSEACPNCQSLFEPIYSERACEDVAIDFHWCTCTGYKYLSPSGDAAVRAAQFAIEDINRMLGASDDTSSKCVRLSLKKIISSSVSDNVHYGNKTFVLLVFESVPKIVIEATVSFNYGGPEIVLKSEGAYSRLDRYEYTAKCVKELKIYCFCQWNLFLQMNRFSFWFEV